MIKPPPKVKKSRELSWDVFVLKSDSHAQGVPWKTTGKSACVVFLTPVSQLDAAVTVGIIHWKLNSVWCQLQMTRDNWDQSSARILKGFLIPQWTQYTVAVIQVYGNGDGIIKVDLGIAISNCSFISFLQFLGRFSFQIVLTDFSSNNNFQIIFLKKLVVYCNHMH